MIRQNRESKSIMDEVWKREKRSKEKGGKKRGEREKGKRRRCGTIKYINKYKKRD